ncbi:hypothetical protein PV325_001380 [Microctonus aethiopoides]|nr:hypothetical protein PV325_001380 [Microctonus aethiopoides]
MTLECFCTPDASNGPNLRLKATRQGSDWYIGPVVGTHIAIGGVNIGRCLCVESIEVLAIIQAAGGYAIADDEDDNDDAAGDGGVAGFIDASSLDLIEIYL